jgi:hypothetical protein
MKNIPVSNKLSKVIIAKDLTIQQRDQNKKKRQEAKRRRSDLKRAMINGRSQMVKLLQISNVISRLENLASSKTKIQEPEKRTGPKVINLPSIMTKLES